jgi:hypothetical protein
MEIGEQLLPGPQPDQAGGRALGERHGERSVVAVLGDLLATAQDAAADLPGVLDLLDRWRPDDRAGDPLAGIRDRDDVAVGRGADGQIAKPRPVRLIEGCR